MNPKATSPVPMKDSMGMSYIPVYAPVQTSKKITKSTKLIINGVYINPKQQQLLDIRTIPVKEKSVNMTISTVGTIAYDPQLYIAQEEYLQTLKLRKITKTNNLVNSAKTRLLLLGMSQEGIKKLEQTGKPQKNLFLGIGQKNIWVYASIYENAIGLIKKGMSAKITSISYPGEVFKGTIDSINPVINLKTRSTYARIKVYNPDNKLKPNMYVNVKIIVPLGRSLIIPQTAIMFSGTRNIVFLSKGNGYFIGKEIKIGHRTGNYYQVISGLKQGQIIARDGTFFIDSESRLENIPIIK